MVEHLLAQADIHIGGNRPRDIVVHDERFYHRVLSQGSLGLGESYMDGWWDCDALDEFITRVLRANLQEKLRLSPALIWNVARASVFNLQNRTRAFQIGERHYDIGNDLYTAMLGNRLTYSCGYWKNATTLDEAQEAKLDLICRKLQLQRGQQILDIGCGWGSFAKFAAEKYGVSIFGITVSKQQLTLAKERIHGLPIELALMDYRALPNQQFDRIVSVGMFEHVGYKNYRTYMKVAHRLLKDNGLFLLHTIGGNQSGHQTDAWIDKYIFPNSLIPSVAQIGKAAEHLFVMEDWHNFGADYDKTLLSWWQNFNAHWPELKEKYGDRFYRLWRYYLLSCAGTFRARHNQLWQIVLSKKGVTGGYISIR